MISNIYPFSDVQPSLVNTIYSWDCIVMKFSPEEKVISDTMKQSIIENAKLSPDGYYGDVSDVDLDRYDHEQLSILSLGRGNCPYMKNVDELDPSKFSAEDMLIVGSLPDDDLLPLIRYLNLAASVCMQNNVETLIHAYRARANNVKMIKRSKPIISSKRYTNNVVSFTRK